jgi:hypothetical protein
MKAKSLLGKSCVFLVVLTLSSCDGWEAVPWDLEFVSAKYINGNTFQLKYKAPEGKEDLSYYPVKVDGVKQAKYDINKSKNLKSITSYTYQIEYEIAPDFVSGDRVKVWSNTTGSVLFDVP